MGDVGPTPAVAVLENDAAVGLLAKGKVPSAITGFSRAVELAPGFVLARYNLACAYARHGDMAAAERELLTVFESDWIGLRAQAARDDDLAAFRASEEGRRLFANDALYTKRYAPAIDRGVRALLWTSQSPDSVVPEGLRAGVWDAETSRFVAISERKRNALAAYVSSDLPYAVFVTGTMPSMLSGDMADHVNVKEVSYWSWDTRGTPIDVAKIDAGAFTAAIRVAGDESSLTMHTAFGYGDPTKDIYELRSTFSPSSGVKTSFARSFPREKDFNAAARARGTLVFPFHNGFITSSISPGYAWDAKKRELRVPESGAPASRAIEIPKGVAFTATAPSILASPKGDRVALVWDTHSCGDACGGDVITVGAHRIVLVEVASGAAKTIAEGTGIGAVRFDPSGRMFVQENRTTFHAISASDPKTWRELPRGVLLVSPVTREDSIQCCGF